MHESMSTAVNSVTCDTNWASGQSLANRVLKTMRRPDHGSAVRCPGQSACDFDCGLGAYGENTLGIFIN